MNDPEDESTSEKTDGADGEVMNWSDGGVRRPRK